jgi:putative Mg2+ transporter-C (MgtC) family protein
MTRNGVPDDDGGEEFARSGSVRKIRRTPPANDRAVSTNLDWGDLLLRLVLTIIAGSLIGVNRGEHGKPAGLRTTVLVCLAASIAMLLANLLLVTRGKTPDSYVQLDMMRLPLGILTGVGFIGAGAILRREDLVIGVTTAATLWLATVIGLCLGAGRLGLGLIGTAFGLLILWGFGLAERYIPQEKRASLVLASAGDAPDQLDLIARLQEAGYAINFHGVSFAESGKRREARFDLRWRGPHRETEPPEFLSKFARQPGVLSLRWEPIIG